MVLPVFLVESKMGAVVLGFRWLWQSFQIAASVLPTMTRVLSPYIVASVSALKV
jgi:hypothetical protein